MIGTMKRDAKFSSCQRYRYWLTRDWSTPADPGRGSVTFIGLNPSVADDKIDDRTIRRCIGFATDWGYTGLIMANLFAYRATKPAVMKAQSDPIGPDNDAHLIKAAQSSGIIIAAWGVDGVFRDRADQVRKLIPNLHYLQLTKAGHPGHPLYLKKALVPRRL